MIRNTAVTSTATPASGSCIASTPNSMPSIFASNSKPYHKISDRQHDRKLEALTDWIREEKFMIPVRQPANGEIVRAEQNNCPAAYGLATITGAGGTYRVCDELIWKTEGQFVHLYGRTILRLTVSSDGSLFLWPIIWPGEDFMSANAAGVEAEKGWVRFASADPSSTHVQTVRQSNFPVPIWPALDQLEIAHMFFGPRVIKSLDHPVHKRLVEGLGEVRPAVTMAP